MACSVVWDDAKGCWYGKVVWVGRLCYGMKVWVVVCDGGMADAMRCWYGMLTPIGAAD